MGDRHEVAKSNVLEFQADRNDINYEVHLAKG